MEKKLKEIRKHIDTLDSQLLELLAKRQYWVEQAGNIKEARDKVYDEARVNEILDKIKQEAKQKGISEDIVLPLWEKLLQLSVAHEFTHYDKKKSPRSNDD
ncbi:MAG: chorismate mutase [Parvibaculales bacterium]